MKTLLTVDCTDGSIADNGSLSCGGPAQDLEDYLTGPADKFYENGDYVIFPTDSHTGDKSSPEYRPFSPHNIVGIPGQELCSKSRN